MSRIQKVLIANRGEIACRVIKSCRTLGIATAVVYSEADRRALHVLEADEAYCIGGAAARESYLSIERVLDAAIHCGADAIHPGYGFLSENADFAAGCEEAGIRFIGPSAAAIERLGNKTRARRLAIEAGVPVVPGSPGPLGQAAAGRELAESIGFPVLIKAAAGGGGKGMRVVRRASEFEASFERATSEALASFGEAAVFVEKYLEAPRHIEIQVMVDAHGNAVHLGERECSVQRRHQKLLEESPSVVVDSDLRRRMGEAALKAVTAGGYTNLGTVEFLLDARGDFYFLEVNTRLQVEHPVTELVTGLDLVREQMRIAEGHELSVSQEQVVRRGHAIECRISAEDPFRGFAPSPGKIRVLREPRGPWVRVDSGVYAGVEISLHYDPLISKVITWGVDRDEASARMLEALRSYVIEGIGTTIPFHEKLLRHPEFRAGNLTTDFIDRHMELDVGGGPERRHGEIAAIAAAYLRHTRPRRAVLPAGGGGRGQWKQVSRLQGRRPWA